MLISILLLVSHACSLSTKWVIIPILTVDPSQSKTDSNGNQSGLKAELPTWPRAKGKLYPSRAQVLACNHPVQPQELLFPSSCTPSSQAGVLC